MSALTATAEFFGFRQDDYAEQQLVARQQESHRLANDPYALADLSAQASRRHDKLTIAELEAAKETARSETEMFCQEIDRMIITLQERSGPLVEGINAHAQSMAQVREMLTKYRGG